MFDGEWYGLGGDQESVFGADEALVAVGAVAVLDVVGHGFGEGVPGGVVGVLDHELADAPEVAFDAEEARVGRGEGELDVGGGRPATDRRGLVGGEVVHDQVDPQVGGCQGRRARRHLRSGRRCDSNADLRQPTYVPLGPRTLNQFGITI